MDSACLAAAGDVDRGSAFSECAGNPFADTATASCDNCYQLIVPAHFCFLASRSYRQNRELRSPSCRAIVWLDRVAVVPAFVLRSLMAGMLKFVAKYLTRLMNASRLGSSPLTPPPFKMPSRISTGNDEDRSRRATPTTTKFAGNSPAWSR